MWPIWSPRPSWSPCRPPVATSPRPTRLSPGSSGSPGGFWPSSAAAGPGPGGFWSKPPTPNSFSPRPKKMPWRRPSTLPGRPRCSKPDWQRLSPSEREVLELVAYDGLTPSEVAAMLNLSPNAARLRLSRARRHLRQVLDPTPGVEKEARHAF